MSFVSMIRQYAYMIRKMLLIEEISRQIAGISLDPFAIFLGNSIFSLILCKRFPVSTSYRFCRWKDKIISMQQSYAYLSSRQSTLNIQMQYITNH